jgi:hypothetical protein
MGGNKPADRRRRRADHRPAGYPPRRSPPRSPVHAAAVSARSPCRDSAQWRSLSCLPARSRTIHWCTCRPRLWCPSESVSEPHCPCRLLFSDWGSAVRVTGLAVAPTADKTVKMAADAAIRTKLIAIPLFPSFVAPPAQRYLTPAARSYSISRFQKTFCALPSFNLIASTGAPQRFPGQPGIPAESVIASVMAVLPANAASLQICAAIFSRPIRRASMRTSRFWSSRN